MPSVLRISDAEETDVALRLYGLAIRWQTASCPGSAWNPAGAA